MKKSTAYCLFILVIFSWQLRPDTYLGKFPKLLKPGQIIISNKFIYITEYADGKSIYIYERKNLKFFKKFGKEGQGPEEFPRTLNIKYYKKKILVSASGKYLWFDEKGNFIKENRKHNTQIFLYPIISGYVCSELKFDFKNNYVFDVINLYDNNLKKVKTLSKYKNKFNSHTKTLTIIPEGTFLEVDNDIIYIGTPSNKKGLIFERYNNKGDQIKILNIPYEKTQIPNSYKNALLETAKKSKNILLKRKYKYIFPKYFPPYHHYKVNNNHMYLFRDISDYNKYQLLVFDTNGVIKNKLLIKKIIKKYYIFDCILYYIIENEDTEEWEFYSKKLL